ncbi:MAG: hypothetical protein Q8Q10_04465 [bacterium]|nr:hypothetical protein [bacterium]
MWSLFSNNKKNKEKEAKAVILKEYFSFSDQKKAVTKAARESAADQRVLVEKYHKLVKVGQ